MDGKHLMRFQSETSVFNFRRRSLNGAVFRGAASAAVQSKSFLLSENFASPECG